MNETEARTTLSQLTTALRQLGFQETTSTEALLAAAAGDLPILFLDYRGSRLPELLDAFARLISGRDECLVHRVASRPTFTREEFLEACERPTPQARVLFLERLDHLSPDVQFAAAEMVSSIRLSRDPTDDDPILCVGSTLGRNDGVIPLEQTLLDAFSLKVDLEEAPVDAAPPFQPQPQAPADMSPAPIESATLRALRAWIRDDVRVSDDVVTRLRTMAGLIREDQRVSKCGAPPPRAYQDLIGYLKADSYLHPAAEVPDAAPSNFAALATRCLGHRILFRPGRCQNTYDFICAIALGSDSGTRPSKHQAPLHEAWEVYRSIRDRLATEVHGRTNDGDQGGAALGTIDLILTALFARGHILLEDYPGSGKSYLAKMLAESLQDDVHEVGYDIELYHRIQCTPDLLPSDITGYMMLQNGRMDFRRGPIFAYMLLVDEINRTTPKVQSALLEAMAESQVTVDDRSHPLGELFFVIATQNPLDQAGTYPLPAASLDRFLFKRRLRPIDRVSQARILTMDAKDALAPWVDRYGQGATVEQRDPRTSPRPIGVSHFLGARRAILSQVKVHPNLVECLIRLGEGIQACCEPGARTVGPALQHGSRPSDRTLKWIVDVTKVIAFVESFQRDTGPGIPIVAQPRHVALIAADFLRHRVIPAPNQDEHTLDEGLTRLTGEVAAQFPEEID